MQIKAFSAKFYGADLNLPSYYGKEYHQIFNYIHN
jgi:hypothetical protein